MSMNRFKVNDKVKVVPTGDEFDNCHGVVNRIDGEYHYVTVQLTWDESVELELYRNEFMKLELLPEELFTV